MPILNINNTCHQGHFKHKGVKYSFIKYRCTTLNKYMITNNVRLIGDIHLFRVQYNIKYSIKSKTRKSSIS